MIQEKIAQSKLDILPELKNRWSPRAFSTKAVEEDKLNRIFEAARWAPSSNNEQPWRFCVAQKGEADYEKLFEGLNEWNQKWAWTAPVVGVGIVKRTFTKNDKENRHAWHDLGLAMGNLLAQSTALGLHVHQMAGIKPEHLYQALNIPKDTYEVVSMFVLGYQDETRLKELEERYHESEYKPRERRARSEFLFGGTFGEGPAWLKEE